MKTLTLNHKRVLFCALIVTLGFSKSWTMTASASTNQADLAESAPTDNGTDPAPARHDRTRENSVDASVNTRNAGRPTTNSNNRRPNIPANARSNATAQAAAAAAAPAPAAAAAAAVAAAPVVSTTITGATAGEAFDKNKVYSNEVLTLKGKEDKLFRITDLHQQTNDDAKVFNTAGELVNSNVKDTVATVALMNCPTCNSEQATLSVSVSAAKSMSDILTAVRIRLQNDAVVNVAAEKARIAEEKKAKQLQASVDACEKDEDGNKLKDDQQYACFGHKAMSEDRNDRLSDLRDSVESDIMDLIKEGPDGVRKARSYIRALKSSVGGDPVLRQYVSRLGTYASDYQQIATLARDSSLNPTHRAQNFLQISQLDQKYGNMPIKHSEETQSYIDTFSSSLLGYAREAETSPYNAYNDYWNRNGNNQGYANNQGNSNNQNSYYNQGNMGVPNGFYATNNGPRNVMNTMSPYQQQQSPYMMQQRNGPQPFGPGYTNNNVNGVPPFRTM